MVDMLKYSYSEFLTAISGGAKNITVEIERRFRKMAKQISEDTHLSDRFRNESPEQLYKEMPDALKNHIHQFISRFGCRARHRTLSVNRWEEAPAEVMGILKSLVHASEHPSTNDASQKALFFVTNGSQDYSQKIHWFLRPALRLILTFTCKYLDLREDLRFVLDKVLYEIRRSSLELGKHTGFGENVLFLTAEELTQLINEGMSHPAAEALIATRRDVFLKPVEAPAYLIDGRAENEFPISDNIMRGIGTSPGRATGLARIVTDPVNAIFRPSDILIANNTDPGWTPILSLVSGMVMEEGGLLNHCSIVARELGIPAIVGVRGATRRIPEGSRITIDGGMGVIRIEESESAKPPSAACKDSIDAG